MRVERTPGGTPGPRSDPRPALRQLANQLESVFLNQLFQAMRESVPQGGITEDAPGKEMFTSLMDEKLAGEAAERMQRGLGERLYQQLCRRLPPAPEAPSR